jgi:hypothetical protein
MLAIPLKFVSLNPTLRQFVDRNRSSRVIDIRHCVSFRYW